MAEIAPTRPAPLWMRVTLVVSLALNVLIIGVVAGFILSGGPDKHTDRDVRDVGTLFTRALAPEDRRAVRREFGLAMAAQGRDRSTILEQIQTTVASLRQDPFDADAFVQALEDQSGQRRAREALGRDVLAARIAEMSDAERLAYADRIELGLRELAGGWRR
ncbi:periplasmic heavy metal sensor [Marivita hallyeonensis]|uniref:Heavy-metal resistance n=1 Tax=Marivita hallyeonensis TaxID=996342 RepID=A0A1M5X2X9_9RHOB|nr:periplasmic heavy metal sensor [Marivita hallyeonensis]SHH93533.1 Heavy-metal resistance [Marivita hallyeonensis]